MKSKKFLTCLGFTTLAVMPAVVSSLTIASIKINEDKSTKFSFDGHEFDNQNDLKNYLRDNLTTATLRGSAISRSYDGQVFNSAKELHEYLEDKFEIEQDLTHLNPELHTISSNGELSNDVIAKSDDDFLRVYGGKNGLAYLDRGEAFKTYRDYQKVYMVDSQEFSSKASAIDYLRTVKGKILELDNTGKKIYYNGGISGDKEELIRWIKRHTKMGFTYGGKDYSDLNYQDFVKEFSSKVAPGTDIFERNITKAVNLNKRGY